MLSKITLVSSIQISLVSAFLVLYVQDKPRNMKDDNRQEFFRNLCKDLVERVWLRVEQSSIDEVLEPDNEGTRDKGQPGEDGDGEDDSEFRLCFCNEGILVWKEMA